MKSKKIDFFDSIILNLYKYYKVKNDSSLSLFKAKAVIFSLIVMLTIMLIFYLEKIINTKILGNLENNYFFSIIIFGIPFILFAITTLKLKVIESLTEDIQKRGKKNLIILVVVIAVLWSIRMIEYYLF